MDELQLGSLMPSNEVYAVAQLSMLDTAGKCGFWAKQSHQIIKLRLAEVLSNAALSSAALGRR
jgi:hypothetical protein